LYRDTSGLLVFAKNEKSKRYLQDNWQEFSKKNFAVVHGKLRKQLTFETGIPPYFKTLVK
jgi:tRNA pseudouridine32 synthase/23S rRNA pseudouridine746 synthase/23S rRNA pseudouridine1911/1915/1917 synthase